MKRLILFLFLLLAATPAFATTYYASASGSGTTCSTGSPGSINSCLNTKPMVADDILILKCGAGTPSSPSVWTGANYMIHPTAGTMSDVFTVTVPGRSGTSGHPITIKAETDGCIILDGQGSNVPINFDAANSWYVVQGIDVKNGTDGDNGCVEVNQQSNNNIFQRIVAWDCGVNTNVENFQNNYSNDNLFEDVAAFGTGRKMYSVYESLRVTIRRAWGEQYYSLSGSGPCSVYTNYSSYHTTFENVIGTWDSPLGQCTGHAYGMLGAFQMTGASTIPGGDNTPVADTYWVGNIGYQFASQSGYLEEGCVLGGPYVDGYTVKDMACYMEKTGGDASPSAHLYDIINTYAPFIAEWGAAYVTTSHVLTNYSGVNLDSVFEPLPSVDGAPSSFIYPSWTRTNVKHATSVSGIYGAQSLYVNDGTKGATILCRTIDRVLTSPCQSLWPWPMNQRIIDAMSLTSYTVRDVDADVYSIWGTPPSVTPGGTPPVENFDSYSALDFLDAKAGGSGTWTGDWTCSDPSLMVIDTALPGGQGGKTVISYNTGGGVNYCYREFAGVSDGLLQIEMRTDSVPNSNDYGFSLNESGVNIRAQCSFRTGTIDCYDYNMAAWIPVCVYSLNIPYSMEVELDSGHPDQYRARCNRGAFTSWMGTDGTLTVVNLWNLLDSSTTAHNLRFDAIGSTVNARITSIANQQRMRRN